MQGSMQRWVNVKVDGAEAKLRLLEEYSPRSVEALWQSLPIATELRHGKLSGEACFLDVDSGPLLDLPAQPELPVTSSYRGYLVLTVLPELGHAELLISYGVAEYRWPTGRRYVTPVARADEAEALYDVLRRMFSEGVKRIEIRRMAA